MDLIVAGAADAARLNGSRGHVFGDVAREGKVLHGAGWGCTIARAADLAVLAEQPLDPRLAALEMFAVEARCEEGPFTLPMERAERLALLEAVLERCGAHASGLK